MREIYISLVFILLVGCKSKEPVNGIYEPDVKHCVTQLFESVNLSFSEIDEKAIKMQEQIIQDEEVVVSINFPKLRFSAKKPTEIDDQFQLKKVGDNQFVLFFETTEVSKEVRLKYVPDEQALYWEKDWGTVRYIKR